MIHIGNTAVCDADRELGKIYKYLDSLHDTESDKSSVEDLKIAKGRLDYHKGRIIVVSAGGFFEQEIYEIIRKTYKTNKSFTLEPFINNITQGKYFQLFDFKSSNINKFYGLFGEKFKEWCKEREKECNMLENIESFMLLNRLRNLLAHRGYDYDIRYDDKSIYTHFAKACEMLNWLSESLKEFEENKNKSD